LFACPENAVKTLNIRFFLHTFLITIQNALFFAQSLGHVVFRISVSKIPAKQGIISFPSCHEGKLTMDDVFLCFHSNGNHAFDNVGSYLSVYMFFLTGLQGKTK
jgi:hypothetical protein